MDTWFIGYTSRWMTTTWMGDDLRERPLGQKDAAFMLTVPMFARYMTEVTAGQPLRDIPWERPPGVKPDDTGGKLRTTMEEVLADGQTDAATAAHKPRAVPRTPPPPPKPPRRAAPRSSRPARQRRAPASASWGVSPTTRDPGSTPSRPSGRGAQAAR